jgi:nucleotide-binding universal stress UspA family protein
MWDSKPWDNDAAADWFAALMEQTNMPALVRKTLLLVNVDDYSGEQTPELRAAAYCMLKFGHVYVWPGDDLAADLQLAIYALKKVLLDDDYCYSSEVADDVEHEIEELEERLKKLAINN